MEDILKNELLETEDLEEVEYIEDNDELYGTLETMTVEELADEILTGCYSSSLEWFDGDYEVSERIANEVAEEVLESRRKPNGKVYVEDYDMFESDIRYWVNKKVEEFEDDET